MDERMVAAMVHLWEHVLDSAVAPTQQHAMETLFALCAVAVLAKDGVPVPVAPNEAISQAIHETMLAVAYLTSTQPPGVAEEVLPVLHRLKLAGVPADEVNRVLATFTGAPTR